MRVILFRMSNAESRMTKGKAFVVYCAHVKNTYRAQVTKSTKEHKGHDAFLDLAVVIVVPLLWSL